MLDWLRRLTSRWRPSRGPRFVIHRGYQFVRPLPDYDRRRPFRILGYLRRRGLLGRGSLQRPRPVSPRRLRRVHDPAYLAHLEEPGAISELLGVALDQPAEDAFLEFQLLMCGGTITATRLARERGGIAINLGGGLHHAAAAAGAGFCLFNDVAVATATARHRGFDGRVLVVDLDLHDGDGTRSIFADDPLVHTFSIHNRDLGDPAAVASTSVALGTEVADGTYLAAIRAHLPPVFAEVQPDLVFYVAGSDPWVEDRLGDWRVTLEGLLERDRLVIDLVGGYRRVRVPTVVLLGGGYGPSAWRHGAAFFSWLITGSSRLDIPLEIELPLDHYRKLARLMRTPGIRQDERRIQDGEGGRDDDWGLSEEDLAGVTDTPESRFMGVFSRHGAEEALEEAGLLDRLREMGFTGLHVSLDLDDPLGHVLTIHAGGPVPQIVVQLKLRVDRNLMRGEALLVVEWLLIQDARSRFELSRPLLPGQEFPGLGLLRDIAAVLIVAAERMELDGLAFTPTHFHLARFTLPQGSFADPVMQARYLKMNEAVADLQLGEAARVIHAGELVDLRTEKPARWAPAPIVIPVGDRLRDYFAGSEYQARVAEACRDFAFDRT